MRPVDSAATRRSDEIARQAEARRLANLRAAELARAAAARTTATPVAFRAPVDQFDRAPVAQRVTTPAIPTPAEAAVRDSAKVTGAKDPAAGAKALADLLRGNKDPAYQQALIGATQATVTQWAQAASAKKDEGRPAKDQLVALVGSLGDAAQAVGPAQAKVLSAAFGQGLENKNLGDDDDELGGAIKQSVKDGHGTLFGAQLDQALRESGKNVAAREAAKFTFEGLRDVRNDFEDARKKANELGGQLQGLLTDLAAAGKSKEELAEVAKQFRADHHEVFDAFEQSGAKLASALSGAAAALQNLNGVDGLHDNEKHLRDESTKALRDLPDLLRTTAGSQAVADALVAQGKGQPSFLDAVPGIAEGLDEKDRGPYLDAVTSGTLQAAGAVATQANQAGNPGLADQVLAGLEKNGRIFRVDANTLAKVVSNLRAPGAYANAVAFKDSYAKLAAATEGLPPSFALGVRGVGAALGTVGLIGAAGNLGQADLNQKIQFALGVTGTAIQTADVVGTALGILGKGAAFSSFAGKAVPGLTIAVAGLSAVDEFQHGDIAGGAADTAVAIGTGLLFAPPPADIVGGVLVAAGTIFKLARGWFSGEGDGGQEQDTQKALELLGVPSDKAKLLRDLENGRHYIGRFIGAEAAQLGISPKAYLDWLVGLKNDDLAAVVHVARTVEHEKDGTLKVGSPDDVGNPYFGETTVSGATALLKAEGLVPPGT
ncbi:MAG: hypothetical protein K1X89_24410 [Myxococcaceae bacterium]|nr:hypothetical protein [Myxococcaceae bacterium]